MIEYSKDKIAFSRGLRKNMTSCERKIWYLFLRNYPLRFQRQKVLGEYIADFYCAKAHLIIEIDGEGHDSIQNVIHDNLRTKYIANRHYRVLRITNEELENNFYETCEYIDHVVQAQIEQE